MHVRHCKVLNNNGCLLDNTCRVLNKSGCLLDNTCRVLNKSGCLLDNTCRVLNNKGCLLDNTCRVLNKSGCFRSIEELVLITLGTSTLLSTEMIVYVQMDLTIIIVLYIGQ